MSRAGDPGADLLADGGYDQRLTTQRLKTEQATTETRSKDHQTPWKGVQQ